MLDEIQVVANEFHKSYKDVIVKSKFPGIRIIRKIEINDVTELHDRYF